MENLTKAKQRHSFVTVWLWFGVIWSILSALQFLLPQGDTFSLQFLLENGISSDNVNLFIDSLRRHSFILRSATYISTVCLIVGYLLLIKWRKIGFWLVVVTTVAMAAIGAAVAELIRQDYYLIDYMFYSPNRIATIIQIAINPALLITLWAVLHIKKDGISCWDNFSVDPKTVNLSKNSADRPTPISDIETVTGDNNFCTQCGTQLPKGAKFCHSCGTLVQQN